MTDRYRYTITTQSRVSAARTGEMLHHAPAHRIIPGGTVRGALAALWWRDAADRGDGEKQFARLFDEELQVGQAVPTGDGDRADRHTTLSSASTYVCKYEPLEACRHFSVDVALEILAGRAVDDEPVCRVCQGPTKDRPGWIRGFRTRRTTRTELNADGTAKEGNLFDREAMPAGLTLTGTLRVPDGVDLGWADDQAIRIGGKRSVMGACTISLDVAPAEETHLAGATRVAIRLQSPAIVVDRFGSASLAEDQLLAELVRVGGDGDLTIDRSWLRSEQITGWHLRSALPKPTDWALAAGSTAILNGLTDEGWRRLGAGIGLRTLEGFGQLEILLPVDPDEQDNRDAALFEEAPDPVEEAVEALVEAFYSDDDPASLGNAHTALSAVRKERRRPYGRPEPVIAKHRKERWVKQLGNNARNQLNVLFESDVLDEDSFLERLNTKIGQRQRGKARDDH